MKKEIYILIGPAAIGKTTYIKNKSLPIGRFVVISRDEIVGNISAKYNLSFDELYFFPSHNAKLGEYIPGFEKYGKVIQSPSLILHLQPFSYEYINDVNTEIYYAFYNEFQSAIRNENIEHIIIDRVHMRKEERVIYFKYLEFNRQNFLVVAVLFNFQDPDTLDVIEQLSEIRKQSMVKDGRYRTVPRHVQENMIKFYEEPSKDEGFNSIIKVDTLPQLRTVLEHNKK